MPAVLKIERVRRGNKKVAKSKRPQAERAAEWGAVEALGCQHTRRALRTKYARVDFYAADILGCTWGGAKIYIQVTAGQLGAVIERRKKLEAYPWHPSERVFVWQLVERQDVANPRKKNWFFRVWEYAPGQGAEKWARAWREWPDAIAVPSKWFRAYHKGEHELPY